MGRAREFDEEHVRRFRSILKGAHKLAIGDIDGQK